MNITKIVQEATNKLKTEGEYRKKISSTKQANRIAWSVAENLGINRLIISGWKRGRVNLYSEAKLGGFQYHYDAKSKHISFLWNKNS